MKRLLIPILLFMFVLLGCQAPPAESISQPAEQELALDPDIAERHDTAIPEPYAGTTSPVAAEDASSGELYTLHCAACHGDSGMGEGPAGQVLDPPATDIANTSQLVSDDYLVWRISEGGSSFGTAMPAWKGTLTEGEIWSLVNYLRGLSP
ncbi:MAG: cytochrome c [Chloroflexi bacterium]|nr:MAG: cytochrome c [Chloroflexota bacterium]MBL1197284.1 cytochrome c [Chloroflexota bacterium]NOH14579.1 cytochrome c [Chloroflexota bacterium]